MDNQKDTDKLPPEREILRGRTFGLDDAIARAAGGSLKGASPVAAHDQAVFALRNYLEVHLPDPEGSLRSTLTARIDGNPPLVANYDFDVKKILDAVLDQVLKSNNELTELVREVDARWGRDYGERPYFERPNQQPDPDDPYTVDKVKRQLKILRRNL